jgi:hypothetical protein
MSDNDDETGVSAPPGDAHLQFGKMAEVTQHWQTARHPAFRSAGRRPIRDAAAALADPDALADPSLWVATEKVHGANMSFVVTAPGGVVRCAKREVFLDDADDDDNAAFFGYRFVRRRFETAAARAFAVVSGDVLRFSTALRDELASAATEEETAPATGGASTPLVVTRLTVYGEIFGGSFPGLAPSSPDAAPATGPVQDGLFYSPDLQFMAFDACVHYRRAATVPEPSDRAAAPAAEAAATTPPAVAYLDFLPTMAMLRECGFFVAEPLCLGSFQTVCNFPVDFATTVPARLGVPRDAIAKVRAENRAAEGVVCRTNLPQRVPVTTGKGGEDERTIFKRKRAGFTAWSGAQTAAAAATTTAGQRSGRGGGGGAGAGRGGAGRGGAASADAEAASRDALLLFARGVLGNDHVVDSAVSKTGRPPPARGGGGGAAKRQAILERIAELLVADIAEAVDTAAASGDGDALEGASGAELVARFAADVRAEADECLRRRFG